MTFKRFGWRVTLLVYVLVGIALYMLDRLCTLTIPLNQRHLGWFERPLGCKGFELIIVLTRALLYFPATFLVPELLFWLDEVTRVPWTQNELVMFLSPVITNAFLLFLLGSGLDYLRGRR